VSRTYRWLSAVAALVIAALPVPGVAAAADADIQVRVQKNGPEIAVEVDCPVSTSIAVAWEVLTDYDHMADFISNLESSSVQARDGNTLQVYQKGKAARGPLKITFENVREVELVPYQEIRSRLISGDLKASAFTTRVVDDGVQIHIVNSGKYTPKIWVPPFIGPALIEAETRKQFGEIRAEILRRSALRANAASPAPDQPPRMRSSVAVDAPR
jgi:hypothetical protein